MTIIDKKRLNKLWAKSSDLKNPKREQSLYDLAFFLWSNKQFDEAMAVTELDLEVIGDREGSTLWMEVLHLQSLILHDLKRDQEAIEVELRALRFGEILQPASERAFMRWHLAECYGANKQRDLQEVEFLRALEAFIASDNKWFLGQAYIEVAMFYYSSRNYSKSKGYFKLAIAILEETERTDRLPYLKYRMSGIERKLGNPQGALVWAQESLALAKFVNDVGAIRENMIEMAVVQQGMGNLDFAVSILDELIQDNDEEIKNRTTAKAMYFRAQTLQALGKADEALQGYRDSIPLLKGVGLDRLAINAELALIHSNTNTGAGH